MRKILLTLTTALLIGSQSIKAQTARVMAIHNSPDAALSSVDVWLVTPLGSTKLIDNFNFRNASGYIDAPAGINIRVAFAPANSNTINDTLLGYGFNLTANQNYVLMATGTIGTGYTPAKPFDLKVITPVFERITGGTQTQLTLVHASTDAPNVALQVRKMNVEVTSISSFEYGNVVATPIFTDDYFLDILAGDNLVTTLSVPLKSLNLTDSALVVFASGFLNPANNNNGPAFGIFAALSNGTVVQLPVKNTFRLQVVHNCADPAAANVDIWLKNVATNTNTKLLSNFGFRQATPFIDAPALVDLEIGVAPAGSTSPNDIIFSVETGTIPGGLTAIAYASGVLDTSGFAENPNDIDILFDILGLGSTEKALTNGKVTVNVIHGVTDAPAVNVRVKDGPVLFEEYEYGDASDGESVDVDPANYILEIVPSGSANALVSYRADLTSFRDSALAIFASGFLNPSANKNGPAFGLMAVTPGGRVLMLKPITTSVRNIVAANNSLSVYPNPATNFINIKSDKDLETLSIYDMQGRVVYNDKYTENLNLSNLNISKGIYQLVAECQNHTFTTKLMVE
ncbi:MAG: DUF4397 domain-containing protein [Bacteroidia bacterium]